MSFELFDYDPLTGVTEYLAFDNDGKMHIRYEQDVQPILDRAKEIANAGTADDSWKKQEATLYALIPAVVQGQMLNAGINVYDPNHIGRVIETINKSYPHLKTTYKTHNVKK